MSEQTCEQEKNMMNNDRNFLCFAWLHKSIRDSIIFQIGKTLLEIFMRPASCMSITLHRCTCHFFIALFVSPKINRHDIGFFFLILQCYVWFRSIRCNLSFADDDWTCRFTACTSYAYCLSLTQWFFFSSFCLPFFFSSLYWTG